MKTLAVWTALCAGMKFIKVQYEANCHILFNNNGLFLYCELKTLILHKKIKSSLFSQCSTEHICITNFLLNRVKMAHG